MPYIKPQDKPKFQPLQDALDGVQFSSSGELNYALTLIAKRYVYQQPVSYARLNDVVGAMDGAKAEFQRRIVAPYENLKIQENGDVY